MNKLELLDITFKYENEKVLDKFNLSVKDKEFITLFGKSGIGKSTILKIIAGLEFPDEGKVLLDGEDITFTSVNKRNITMALQDSYLFPHMSVEKNIGFGMKIRKLSKAEIKKRVNELLHEVELDGYNNKKPKELSGGEKKRVSLCRAVSFNPKILLLDEPFAGLDDELRVKSCAILKRLHVNNNMTTILVTHDRDDAENLSDRIIEL